MSSNCSKGKVSVKDLEWLASTAPGLYLCRSYLKDLIETTHLFLKMLDNYSKKTGHLVVQSKKRKIRKKAKQQTRGRISTVNA